MKVSNPNNSGGNEATSDNRSITSEVLSSVDIFKGKSKVEISHDGEIYMLRQTRQGKLILTK